MGKRNKILQRQKCLCVRVDERGGGLVPTSKYYTKLNIM